ncbi:MAG: chemotaxis protein CheX [Bryobacteraceae bacterium]
MLDREQIVSEIRSAAEEVFATMLNAELNFVGAYLDSRPAHPVDGVICLIGMAGQWTGTGTLSCSAEFACRIASLMLMSEYSTVDSEVLDAVAEIANMVLGNVKTALERTLGAMGMSIPTAIFGKNFLAKSFGDESWSVVAFDCQGQRLEVKLFLKKAPVPATPGPARNCTPVYLRP